MGAKKYTMSNKKSKKSTNDDEFFFPASADEQEAQDFADLLEQNLFSIMDESDDGTDGGETEQTPVETPTANAPVAEQNSDETDVERDENVAPSVQETSPADEPTNSSPQPTEEPSVEPQTLHVGEKVKPSRIWEVDFVRGLMILFVVWDHFMWDINCIGTSNFNTGFFQWLYDLSVRYYNGALRDTTHDTFVYMFVLTSGISCSFSRSNGKRALKMCIFAALFSAVTYAASAILQTDITIYFNVIHVIALSVAIYAGIEWIWSKLTKNWQKNIFGVVFFAVTMTALVLGHCTDNMNVNWIQYVFDPNRKSQWLENAVQTVRWGGDYWSFIPSFGWFLVGVLLGKVAYRERKSVFPSVNPKYVCPITFCGKYSIWIYFASQVVMYGLVYLLHVMFDIL